jgi:hypothetical protein
LYISIHKTASETVRELLDPYTQMTSCADLQTICYHHIPAKKMKYYFSERFNDGGVGWNWDEYFKFTTVRNPWDRKLSTFSYLKRKAEEFKKVDMGYDPTWFVEKVLQIDNECANFKQYLRKYCKPNKKRNRQVDWVLDREGNNMLDFVGKVENLEHDVKYAFKQIGLPEPNIVHKNKSNHRPYVDAYDEQWMIDKVAKRYADDIKHFNYEFGK